MLAQDENGIPNVIFLQVFRLKTKLQEGSDS